MDPVSPFLGPISQHEQFLGEPGREVLHHKHKDARYTLRVIQYSKQYGVRRAAEIFKVSAGSIAWRHSWGKREEELKKNVPGGMYTLSGGGWGGGLACIGLCWC